MHHSYEAKLINRVWSTLISSKKKKKIVSLSAAVGVHACKAPGQHG